MAPNNSLTRSSVRDVNDSLGIRDWAAAMAVSPEHALAGVSMMLAAAAGPDAWLGRSWGPVPLPKLDLLVDAADPAPRLMIEALVGPLRMIHQRLAGNMGALSSEALDYCVAGPFARNSRHKRPEDFDKALKTHWRVLNRSGMESLAMDLETDPVTQRLEAVRHPALLVERARGRELERMIDTCHQRCGLALWPVLDLARRGAEPQVILNKLEALADGTVLGLREPGSVAVARAHLVLAARPADIAVIAKSSSSLMGRLLWLKSGKIAQRTPERAAAAAFFERYSHAIYRLVEMRRAGDRPAGSLETNEATRRFESLLRDYQGESADANRFVGLPETILWSLLWLCDQVPAGRRPSETALVATAFDVSRRLCAAHESAMDRLLRARDEQALRDFAGRIVRLVAENAPCGVRDITRGFKDQRRARFDPLLDRLVGMGVLTRLPDNRFDIGDTPLEEVWEDLWPVSGKSE